jgi:hypothetical protein
MPITVTQAEVDTRNAVNAMAERLHAELTTLLAPYQGKKIIKTTPYRGWIAKLKPLMDAKQDAAQSCGYRLVFSFGTGWLACELDRTVPIPGTSAVEYVKTYFTFASVDDAGILSHVHTGPLGHRTDYSVEEVNTTFARIEELQSQLRDLQSEVREFTR